MIVASLPLTVACVAQRAMHLSSDQKTTLREEYARVITKSAELQRERSALLQTLDVRMTSDDGHTTERISQVRSPYWSTVLWMTPQSVETTACRCLGRMWATALAGGLCTRQQCWT